jgi:hypothetical protein
VAGPAGNEDLRRALPAQPRKLALGLADAGSRPRSRTRILIQPRRTRAGRFALVALRAAISVSIAAVLTAYLASQLSRSLDITTDVVGYPIFNNFNVDRYFWVYVLWVAFFPLAALAIDIALSPLTGGQFPGLSSASSPDRASDQPDSALATPAVELVRTAFVGLVLGVEVAIALEREGVVFLLVCVGTTVVYSALALRIAVLTERFRGGSLSFPERLAAVNVLASPLTVLGLYFVSEATTMEVLATGNVHQHSWFPFWLALLLTACLLPLAVLAVRRADTRIHLLERRFVLLIPAPVLLLLVLTELPGELGVLDFFHEGEGLAAADLTADGAFPWRDLMFIHGFLHDIAIPTFSLGVFENTRWGGAAGASVLVFPFYWLSQYFLFVYLFGRNVLFLIGTQLAVVLGLLHHAHLRFILMPFALLLLAAVLRKPTWPRMAALAAVVATQTVVSPETTIFVPALFVVLVLFELSSYDRGLPLRRNFRRTLGTAAAGSLILGAFALVLAAFHALDDFFFFYRTFAPDHSLTGGIPIVWLDTRFNVAAIAPVVLVILAIWFFATALRTRWRPVVDDWVMASLAITVALYYPKFLGRADVHVYQPWAVAVPLLAYAIYRVVGLVENRTAQIARVGNVLLPPRYWLTAAALVLVTVAAPRGFFETAGDIPGRLSSQAHNEPVPWRLGYFSPFAIDLAVFSDLERTLDTFLEPRDRVFDFSNNPMLFHYLLDRRPSTRYFHVSMAIRKHTQADLVEELERDPPKLVVFSSSPAVGLPWWDGIANQVRHYDVSRYVLDHYRPIIQSHTFVLMARSDFARSVAFRNADQLYFANLPCDWGYAPNFLDTRPEPEKLQRAISVPFRPTAGVVKVVGWGVDLAAAAPAQEVVAAQGSRVIARATPDTDRPDIAGRLEDQRYTRAGFTMIIPVSLPLERLRFFVLTRSGEARELVYGSALAPTRPVPKLVVTSAGRSYRVSSSATYGEIESAAPESNTYSLELPAKAVRTFNWLEIQTRSSFVVNTLGVTDRRGDLMRTIAFETLDRGRRSIWVQVGACSQWHGFRGNRLYLESVAEQQISGVRLVP